MKLTPQLIEELKAAGYYFTAGALAKQMGGTRFYGCHYGMRSTRNQAKAEYECGFDAA